MVLVFCRRSQYVFHVEIILFILGIIKEEPKDEADIHQFVLAFMFFRHYIPYILFQYKRLTTLQYQLIRCIHSFIETEQTKSCLDIQDVL